LDKASSLPQIAWRDHHFTIDLLLDAQRRCVGALVLDESSGAVHQVKAKAVVLATGGAGQIYARTTNPPVATGDGIAMAYRAGAIVEDIEFVQFHPTTLYLPATPQFLLTEAMRGEGGILRNIKGEAFMKRYHEMAEMAPRDVVSRAVWNEMVVMSSRHIYLDVTHLAPGFIRERFPTIYATCLRYDVDITEEMIPVCPSAHFMMGGVWTDTRGATSVPGLFAAGEVACTGVHGANRLASNSLLEGLVFGARAAAAMQAAPQAAILGPARVMANGSSPMADVPPSAISHQPSAMTEIRDLMWRDAGLFRTREGLVNAMERLDAEYSLRAPTADREYAADPGAWRQLNLVTVARHIARAALRREESRGAHFRQDF